jgi:putative holliday junction resolvase
MASCFAPSCDNKWQHLKNSVPYWNSFPFPRCRESRYTSSIMIEDERLRASARLTALTMSKSRERQGRILAADYGRKRIGLALSDELRLTAKPLMTLVRINREEDIARLRIICRENSVNLIVVGHPLLLSGEVGEMAAEAERFANRLNKNLGIPVELIDERLTSWEAHEITRSTAGKPQSSGSIKPIDEVAAAILLREYLERQTVQLPQPAPSEAH